MKGMRPASQTVKNWRWWVVIPYVIGCRALFVLPLLAIQCLGRALIVCGEKLVDFEFMAAHLIGRLVEPKNLIKWVFDKHEKGNGDG